MRVQTFYVGDDRTVRLVLDEAEMIALREGRPVELGGRLYVTHLDRIEVVDEDGTCRFPPGAKFRRPR